MFVILFATALANRSSPAMFVMNLPAQSLSMSIASVDRNVEVEVERLMSIGWYTVPPPSVANLNNV